MSISYTLEHEEKIFLKKHTHTIDRTTLMMMKRERKFCIKTKTPGLMKCNEIIETNSTAVACILHTHTHTQMFGSGNAKINGTLYGLLPLMLMLMLCMDIFALKHSLE